jgi:hypothetical protein
MNEEVISPCRGNGGMQIRKYSSIMSMWILYILKRHSQTAQKKVTQAGICNVQNQELTSGGVGGMLNCSGEETI